MNFQSIQRQLETYGSTIIILVFIILELLYLTKCPSWDLPYFNQYMATVIFICLCVLGYYQFRLYASGEESLGSTISMTKNAVIEESRVGQHTVREVNKLIDSKKYQDYASGQVMRIKGSRSSLRESTIGTKTKHEDVIKEIEESEDQIFTRFQYQLD